MNDNAGLSRKSAPFASRNDIPATTCAAREIPNLSTHPGQALVPASDRFAVTSHHHINSRAEPRSHQIRLKDRFSIKFSPEHLQ